MDGLRAFAVLPVILFHAGFKTFSGGFVGVDVFFVISGYLITSIIIAEKQAGTFTLLDFYERRARRIFPALFVVMFACLPIAWICLLPQDMKSFSQSVVAVPALASNYWLWKRSGYFEPAAEQYPLLHTWSLSVEEQYYLLFPLFLMLIWRLGQYQIVVTLGILAGASLAAAFLGTETDPVATFYLLPTRAWELLMGALAAFSQMKGINWQPNKKAREAAGVVGLALITYPVFVFDVHTPFPGLYALMPTVGTALIILYASRETVVGKILCVRPLVGIGLVSYSAYLWHQPLFAFARNIKPDALSDFLLSALAVISIILGHLSRKYVEIPFRTKHLLSRKQVFIYGVIGGSLFLAFGLAGHFTNGFRQRFSPNEQIIADYRHYDFKEDYWGANCLSFPDDRSFKLNELCSKKIEESDSIVLWGDSHAAALSIGLRKFTNNLLQYTKPICPPGILNSRIRGCSEANNLVLSIIKNHQPRHIYIHAYWSAYNEPYIEQLGDTISELRAASPRTKIIVIGSVPTWRQNLPDIILAKTPSLDGEIMIVNNNYEKLRALDNKIALLALSRGAFFFSALDCLCKNRKCYGSLNDGEKVALTAWDSNHITRATAARLAEQLFKNKTDDYGIDK